MPHDDRVIYVCYEYAWEETTIVGAFTREDRAKRWASRPRNPHKRRMYELENSYNRTYVPIRLVGKQS